MTLRPIAWVALCLVPTACALNIASPHTDPTEESERDLFAEQRGAIVVVLDTQAAAWNRGDLEGFMDGYWRSPELIFTSGGRIQRGWQTTLDRYVATYGNATETMGNLTFSDLEVRPLGNDSAWALGRWRLERDGQEPIGGVFSLIFRNVDGEWLVVHDHTSLAPAE